MNPIRKIYCRIFQQAFHIAIPLLPYRRPQTLESLEDVPGVLKAEGVERALIVTDPGVVKLGLTKHLEAALTASGIDYALFGETVPNPTTQTVAAAIDLYRKHGARAIIAVGGGSSMDCGKAVGILAAHPGKKLARYKGILKVWKKLPPLIAIPTTAGTGSETTLAAIITDANTRHKYAINSFPLIPHYAVLDPEMTVSLPPSLTASTGLDALTHAVEAYIGNSTTRKTREDALSAVRLIFENLERAFDNGGDLEARRNMLRAAYRAGCAFTVSYVGYVHAVAHSLGGEYDVPHGYANAVILPMVLRAYGATIHKKLAELAKAAGLYAEGMSDAQAAEAFISAIEAMKRHFGIGDTIAKLRREDIRKLSKYADSEANPLYPVPVLMDARELERFYEMLLEEKQ